EKLRRWIETTKRATAAEPAQLAASTGTSAPPPAPATESDPFAIARLAAPAQAAATHPEASRRREALEAFALDSMQMVGVLHRGGKTVAVLRVGDQIHHVGVGQYMGMRHGRVTRITDQEITLRELVLEGESDWKEHMTSLKLEASST
ncbi:pilus assembly protein PilP, partial [Cupriavidus plantarum]